MKKPTITINRYVRDYFEEGRRVAYTFYINCDCGYTRTEFFPVDATKVADDHAAQHGGFVWIHENIC